MVPHPTSKGKPEFSTPDASPDIDVARFIRFLKQIKLKKVLSKIADPRQQSKITYTNYSLLMCALAVFF